MNRDVGRHPRPDRRPSARRRAASRQCLEHARGSGGRPGQWDRAGVGPSVAGACPRREATDGTGGRHGAAGVEPSDPRRAAVRAWPAASGEVRAGGRGIPAVPGGPARGRRSDRRPLRPGQRPAQPGPLCRILAGLRRFPRRGARAISRSRTARYRVGELSYLTGDLPAARRALEAFTGAKGDHPALETAWTYLGDVRFAQNDLPAARAAYERSLADYPRGRLADRARYGLARTLAASGEPRPGAARVPRAGRPRRTGLGRPRLAPGRLDRAGCRPAGRRRRGPRDAGAHRPLEPTERRSPAPARPGARPSRPVRRGRTPAPRPGRRQGQPARGAGRARAGDDRAGARSRRLGALGGRRRARAQRPLPLAAGAPVPVGRGPAAARPPGGGGGAVPPGRRDRTR